MHAAGYQGLPALPENSTDVPEIMLKNHPLPGRVLRALGLLAIALPRILPVQPSVAHAQAPTSITATGTLLYHDDAAVPISLTFPPQGGPVSGSIDFHHGGPFGDVDCDGTLKVDFQGFFTGGDGGRFAGAAQGTARYDCDDGSALLIRYDGPWSGSLQADGTASGEWYCTASLADSDEPAHLSRTLWQVAFSPDVFHAAASAAITPAYIYAAYGIRVENGLGGYRSGQVAWTEAELALLNDVLRVLPPSVLHKMTAARIVRSRSEVNAQGQPDRNEFATYLACDLTISPNCAGASATIRIYDRAHVPFDFSDDPRGDTQFKATILHELTHALENYRQPIGDFARSARGESRYPSSSLIEDWIAATRIVPEPSEGLAWTDDEGWIKLRGKWMLLESPGNAAPTSYAETGPSEDLAESVMLYVFDPQRLRSSSYSRYVFIRDHMFDGIEYRNGLRIEP